jgi:hypothetical protein
MIYTYYFKKNGWHLGQNREFCCPYAKIALCKWTSYLYNMGKKTLFLLRNIHMGLIIV